MEEKKQLTDTAQNQTDFQAEEGPGRVHSLHVCVWGGERVFGERCPSFPLFREEELKRGTLIKEP